MARFEEALPWVLKHEGGWSDDPHDPGGATMYGITLATARHYDIATKEQLRDITQELVERIYLEGYWRFDSVESQAVATKLFDMAVNLGPAAAARIAQRVCQMLGQSVTVDGRLGPISIAAINACNPDQFLRSVVQLLSQHYHDLTEHNPVLGKFLKGWLRRAEDLP